MRVERILLLLLPAAVVYAGWDNDWDGPLHFQCDQNIDSISSIMSEHDNHREDRRFEFECSTVTSSSHSARCYWTHYVNRFDELVHFACPQNGYINGMSSIHNNHHEDRRWKFRCCETPKLELEACYFSGWTNGWDRPQNFRIHHGTVLKGVVSMHDNHREDRRFDFLICKSKGSDYDGWIDGRTDEEKTVVAEDLEEEEEQEREWETEYTDEDEDEKSDDVNSQTTPVNRLFNVLFGNFGKNGTLYF